MEYINRLLQFTWLTLQSSRVQSAILWFWFAFLLLHLILKYVSGLSIGFINPFLLKICNISYTDKKVNVKIRSIRLVLSFSQRTKLALVLDGANIKMKPQEDTATFNKSKTEKNRTQSKKELKEKLSSLKDEDLASIFPDSRITSFIIKYYLLYFRFVGLKIFDMNVNWEGSGIGFNADTFFAKVSMQKHEGDRFDFKASTRSCQHRIDDIEVIDTMSLDIRGGIDVATGLMFNIKVSFEISDLSLPVMSLIKAIGKLEDSYHVSHHPKHPKPKANDDNVVTDDFYYLTKAYNKLCIAYVFVKFVEEINISLVGLNITQIPLANSNIISCRKYKPLVLFDFKIKSFIWNLQRLHFDSPGYGLSYTYHDKPYHIVCNFTGISVQMHNTQNKTWKHVIAIPVLNCTGSSNLAFQTIEAIKSHEGSSAKLILINHVSEPVFDFSTDDITTAVVSALDFKRYLNKLRSTGRNEFETSATTSGRSFTDKWNMLKREFLYWPLLDIKSTVENPTFMVKSPFNEEFYRILVMKLSLLSVELKSGKRITDDVIEYFSNEKLNLHNLRIQYNNNATDFESNILKVEDIVLRLRSDIVPDSVVESTLDLYKPKIDLSELHALHGLNYIFNEIDDKLRPILSNYHDYMLETFGSQSPKLPATLPKTELPSSYDSPGDEHSALQIINNFVPCWLKSFKIGIHDSLILFGSRSLLISKELMKSIDPHTENDLVNSQLRKIKFELDSMLLSYRFGIASDDTTQSSTGSSLEDDDKGLFDNSFEVLTDSNRWRIKFSFEKLICKIISEKSSGKDILKDKIFLKIPTYHGTLIPCYEPYDKLLLNISISKIDMFYSVITHFIIISSLHVIRNTVFEFLLRSPLVESYPAKHKEKSIAIPESFGSKLMKSFEVNFDLEFADLILVFPDKSKVRLELTRMNIMGMFNNPILINSHYLRLCAESPTSAGYWSRLVSAVDGSTSINVHSITNDDSLNWVDFNNECLHMMIPNQFVVYNIFENISVTIKTLEQLHYSLKHNSTEMAIYPKARKAHNVPNMNLKSARLIMSMEDDPFEAEMNMVFQVGLMEQKMRVEKMKTLENKITQELAELLPKTSKSSVFDRASQKEHSKATNIGSCTSSVPSDAYNKVARPLRHSQSVMDFEIKYENGKHLQNREALSHIIAAKERAESRVYRLKQNLSTSWISRVKNYRKKLESEFQSSLKFLIGSLDLSQFSEEFNRKVLEFSNYPSLLNLILEDVDLNLGAPACGLENVPQFLYDVGKGIPLDTEYFTLIPVHLDLRLSELRCHLRDYPLPFIFMPPITNKQSPKLPGIRTYGDLVIAEQMIQSHAEVREIYVPLVPGCYEDEHDDCHSLEVPKTLTSIKVYTNLNWELNSELSTKVTWGTSYQPCIQQVMLNLDNFTKPPIDISKKVGFWDKLRCLFHARMNFRWNYGGELHIQFKGSKNPYSIIGPNSGFLLGFKDNISLSVNAHDDPSQFLTAHSDQIKFAVPNLIAEPLLVWCRHSHKSVLLENPDTNYQMSAFGFFLTDHDSVDVKKFDILKDVFIEKSVITLSGGVQFNLALAFERKVNAVERSNHFSPHYDVVLKNPKYVEDKANYDAYDGFRSEYIHMGFTLISIKDDAYNTVQLSPHSFKNFFEWWRMFSNTLPVRHGSLFGPAKTSKKFSRHLYTIKYQFILEPLFISHVYHDSDAITKNFETIECIGLKGRASKFVVDLHQRKEIMVDYNTRLGVTKKIMKMKFNVGKVNVENLDMRTLKGVFELIENNTNESSVNDSDIELETFDDNQNWLDITDFAELSEPFLVNYRGSVLASPLMFTPRFIYDMHNDYGDKYQIDFDTNKKIVPFGKECFHDCALGINTENTQIVALTNRIEELDHKLTQNKDLIERLGAAESITLESKKHINQLKLDNEQLKHGVKHLNELLNTAQQEVNGDNNAVSLGFFKENGSDNSFMNKYTVHNMLLKWNNTTRNIVYKFIYLFEMNSSISKFLNYKSLAQLDDIIAAQHQPPSKDDLSQPVAKATKYDTGCHRPDNAKFGNVGGTRASKRLKNFKEELREIASKFFHSIHDDHLVRFISPQIQLQTESDEQSCVLIVAPSIQMEVISFHVNETDDDYNANIFEQRFGAVLTDSSIFVFRQDELVHTGKQFFNSSSYGSTTNWPPWLGIELCYDGILVADHVLMNKTSFNVRADKIISSSYLGEEDNINKVSCDLSQAVFTCDAKQYYTLYNIIMKLLIYNEPRAICIKERESKLLLRLDLNKLSTIRPRIHYLQESLKNAEHILDNLSTRRAILNEIERDDMYVVANAMYEASRELHTLMSVSLVGNNYNSTEQSIDYQEWVIRADGIKLHMLDEYRTPFLDVVLENSFYKRIESTDRSDRNVISIQNLEIINLDKESKLPVLFSGNKDIESPKLRVFKEADTEPLIHLIWHMDHPVGGIRLMRKFDVDLQPIQLSLEETTGHKFMKYAFPNDDESTFNDVNNSEGDHEDSVSFSSIPRSEEFKNNAQTSNITFNCNESIKKKSATFFGSKKKDINNIDSVINSGGCNSISPADSISYVSDNEDDGVDEMVKRASDYISFISFNLRSTVISITFRGNGSRRLINVSDFVLTLPTICLNNRTCTLLDLVNHLKKVIIKSLLSHTGSIIGNKIAKHSSKQQRLIERASAQTSLR